MPSKEIFVERRTEHWAVKKEINVANILVTVGAVATGVWWLFSLDAKVDLEDNAIRAEIDLLKREVIYNNERIMTNTAANANTVEYLKSIDNKLGIIIEDFSFFKGKQEGRKR